MYYVCRTTKFHIDILPQLKINDYNLINQIKTMIHFFGWYRFEGFLIFYICTYLDTIWTCYVIFPLSFTRRMMHNDWIILEEVFKLVFAQDFRM